MADNYNKNTQEIYDKTIKEFVGADWRGGLCAIPRRFSQLKQIRNYIKSILAFAGITDIKQDDYGNMWFDIPAAAGWEKVKPLIIQAHMDSAWEAKPGYVGNKPIPVKETIDGKEVIHSENFKTTLGADNGIGLALILAIAKSPNVLHGPIRFLLSADEMLLLGAEHLGIVSGSKERIPVIGEEQGFNYLLSVDGDNLGEIFLSACGGNGYHYRTKRFAVETNLTDLIVYELSVKGGKGGHSGKFMSENHCNAIKAAAQIVKAIDVEIGSLPDGVRLIKFESSTNALNMIPGDATLTFACSKIIEKAKIDEVIKKESERIKKEHPNDANIVIECVPSRQYYVETMNRKDSIALYTFISELRYGPKEWRENNDLVSSSNISPVLLNLDVQSADVDQFKISVYSRSEIRETLEFHYARHHQHIFDVYCQSLSDETKKLSKPEMEKIAVYPPYDYKENDVVRQELINAYEKYGIPHKEIRLHAGLESCWWNEYNKSLNQVIIGPTIINNNTVNEMLDLDSLRKAISIILDLIELMKTA